MCAQLISCFHSAIPWTVARQAPLFIGFFQARILVWVAIPSSRGFAPPRDQTWVSCTGRQILNYYCLKLFTIMISKFLRLTIFPHFILVLNMPHHWAPKGEDARGKETCVTGWTDHIAGQGPEAYRLFSTWIQASESFWVNSSQKHHLSLPQPRIWRLPWRQHTDDSFQRSKREDMMTEWTLSIMK